MVLILWLLVLVLSMNFVVKFGYDKIGVVVNRVFNVLNDIWYLDV